MSTVNEKLKQLSDVENLGFISGTLLEVSARRMQKLRDALAENRKFYTEMGKLYSIIKQSAVSRKHLSPPDQDDRSNKRAQVAIALTSNRRFYGSLNHDLVEKFIFEVSRIRTDCVVIGETGREIIEHSHNAPSCQFVTFTKDDPTTDEIHKLLERLAVYQQIFVYYPFFKGVFTQEVAALDITFTPTAPESEESIAYIFEPELPQILDFFEHRVRYLLFKRVLLEAGLARVGARFVAMSISEHQAGKLKKQLTQSIHDQVEFAANRELLESLTGVTKWRHKLENS